LDHGGHSCRHDLPRREAFGAGRSLTLDAAQRPRGGWTSYVRRKRKWWGSTGEPQ
jgi:hypothetical protein